MDRKNIKEEFKKIGITNIRKAVEENDPRIELLVEKIKELGNLKIINNS